MFNQLSAKPMLIVLNQIFVSEFSKIEKYIYIEWEGHILIYSKLPEEYMIHWLKVVLMIAMFPHYSFDWVIKTNRTSKKFSKTFVGTTFWQRVFIFALCKLKWAFTNVSMVGKLRMNWSVLVYTS